MIKSSGGNSIAINSPDQWSKKWEYELRSRKMDAFTPDYGTKSELFSHLKSIIEQIT
jgi:hypothetical protein